jgi:Flp pilus assembly protein TadG
MRTSSSWTRIRGASRRESGQVMVFVLLGLGTFLIGAMAFAIDLSNLWFHRQSAQSAADAACTAGAMDLLSNKTNNTTTAGNFQQGVNFDCNATFPNTNNGNPAPCVFAALNGYPSSLLQSTAAAGNLGDNVSVIFNGAPPPGIAAATVLEVDVIDNLPTFLAGMLMGKTSQTVRAIAKCGIDQVAAPIPLLVLDPLNPDSHHSAFDVQGSPDVTIYGGPQQSIQVNSVNSAAVNIGGSALVDLSQGGPGTPPTGSDFGVQGGPTTPPSCSGGSGFCYGTTGQWVSPHSQILDPLQNVVSPTTSYNGTPLTTYHAANSAGGFDTTSLPAGLSTLGNGAGACSITGAGNLCVVFLPGNYPEGICLGSSCGPGGNNAHAGVFVEGLYYIGGTGLTLNSNSCTRMSTATGPGSFSGWGGVIFYFSGSATLNVAANAGDPGSNNSCDSAVPYNTTTGAPTGFGVSCDANSQTHAPSNLPATLTGNVLLGPCRGTWGDPYLAASLPVPANPGTQRGILFFQDRHAQAVVASAGGGGSYAMAGTFYFHSCSATSIDGTNGLGCTQPTGTYSTGQYFNNSLQMGGGSGTSSYVLGEIIVDNLQLGGNGSIYMDLDPSSALNVYKAALYQ